MIALLHIFIKHTIILLRKGTKRSINNEKEHQNILKKVDKEGKSSRKDRNNPVEKIRVHEMKVKGPLQKKKDFGPRHSFMFSHLLSSFSLLLLNE